jgi:hypothetical protein
VGVKVPIYPVKGVTITVPGAPWADRPKMPIIDDGRLFGFVPLGDRMRVSGSAEVAGLTRRRARHAARRSSTMSSASFRISPNASIPRRRSNGRESGR